MDPKGDIRVFSSAEEACRAAAEEFSQKSAEAMGSRGIFTVALSGGSTPKGLYALLAVEPFKSRVAWDKTHFFWGDERCVPPSHPESNYGMAREALLSKAPVPERNIHRVRAEIGDPLKAAEDYERELRLFFKPAAGEPPRFDLMLLGLGADGHTASLFPHSPALREHKRLAVACRAETAVPWRVTLTLPVINGASHIIFLVAGAGKARAVQAVLEGPGGNDEFPARNVRPKRGTLLWLLDEAAAGASKPCR